MQHCKESTPAQDMPSHDPHEQQREEIRLDSVYLAARARRTARQIGALKHVLGFFFAVILLLLYIIFWVATQL